MFWLRNSCRVHERKTKECAASWTFQHESWQLNLFAALMFAGLHNHFSPKAMLLLIQAWLIKDLLYRIKNSFFLRDIKHVLEGATRIASHLMIFMISKYTFFTEQIQKIINLKGFFQFLTQRWQDAYRRTQLFFIAKRY